MFEVSRCKVAYLLTFVTIAILALNNGSRASASPSSTGDDKLTENKNLASFSKRIDGSDLLAVASTGSLASASASALSSSSQRDDKDFDDGQKQDIVPAQKRPISEPDDRASSRRDRDRASIDRADSGSKKDAPRDDEDYDDVQRDQRQPIRANRGRDRSRGRGKYNGNNRARYDEEDNEDIQDRQDDDRGRTYDRGQYDRCRRCNEDYDDDRGHRVSTFGSLFEPMFDMMRRMPINPAGVSASSSVSSSDDGLSRSSGTYIHNGRVRGFFSETGRDGRTRTKYIGDEDD